MPRFIGFLRQPMPEEVKAQPTASYQFAFELKYLKQQDADQLETVKAYFKVGTISERQA